MSQIQLNDTKKTIEEIIRARAERVKERHSLQPSADRGLIWRDLLHGIWDDVSSAFADNDYRPEANAAEAAVLALVRRGTPREKIIFRQGCFYIPLPHFYFEIRKEDAAPGYRARPLEGERFFSWTTPICMRPDHFAELANLFDGFAPMMRETMADIDRELRELDAKRQKRQMVRNIKIMTIQAILDQYPLPEGIETDFFLNGDDIHIRFFREHDTDQDPFSVVLPYDGLAESLPNVIATLMIVCNHK